MNERTLYRKNVNSIGTWRIWSEGDVVRIAHATVQGGSEVFHEERIETNKSGRSLDEQIKLRINSRISRLRDRGYKDTVEDAIKNPGNQLGLERPMLAQSIKKVANVNFDGAVLQKKLDGHRCLITRSDGELIAYSRLGKRIDAIKHILGPLEARIDEGTTIDGELYCHGYALQTLASWIKREQPSTYNLFFVGYDVISSERYVDRHAHLTGLLQGLDTGAPGKIVALPYREYAGSDSTSDWFREVRKDGFEGLMLRLDRRSYEAGTRSSGLLKIKEFHDDEFEVLDVIPSKEGWGICVMRAPPGSMLQSFKASAPGTKEQKRYVLENKHEFIGKKLTIEYAHITDDGVPFQPTATRWYVEI